jgi:hypothetical protein
MRLTYLIIAFIGSTSFVFGQEQTKKESLRIFWPEEYNWKIGSNQENAKQQMIELISKNETIGKWTIIGTMISMKGRTGVSMDVAMNLMFDQAKKTSDPTLTMVERNDTTRNPWIIFKIETPNFKDNANPESQLFYIVQGDSSLYLNFVAIKKKSLSSEFVEKWKRVFEASKLVYE